MNIYYSANSIQGLLCRWFTLDKYVTKSVDDLFNNDEKGNSPKSLEME